MVKKAIGTRHEKEKRRKDVELGFGRSGGKGENRR